MKVLTLALILISIGVNAQRINKDVSKVRGYTPPIILLTTFAINENIMQSKDFNPNKTAQIAVTGIAFSVISYYSIKYIEEHQVKVFKRKRKSRHLIAKQ